MDGFREERRKDEIILQEKQLHSNCQEEDGHPDKSLVISHDGGKFLHGEILRLSEVNDPGSLSLTRI